MESSKYARSFRLSPECLQLIERLTVALGISQTAVVEQAVRRLARVEVPEVYAALLEVGRGPDDQVEKPSRPGRTSSSATRTGPSTGSSPES